MDDEIERMVERAHRHDGANRFLAREGQARGVRRGEVHRNFAAVKTGDLLGGKFDAVDRSIGLDAGVGERLAAFPRDEKRELIAASAHQFSQAAEDFDAPRRREPAAPIAERRPGSAQHRIHLGPLVYVQGCEFAAVKGLVHREIIALGHTSAPIISQERKRARKACCSEQVVDRGQRPAP